MPSDIPVPSGVDPELGPHIASADTCSGPELERSRMSLVAAFFATIFAVFFSPFRFFETMRREGGIVMPVVFATICTVVGRGGGYLALHMRLQSQNGRSFYTANPPGAAPPAWEIFFPAFLLFALLFVITPVLVCIQAAVAHGVLLLTGGTRASFAGTVRVVCYASAILLAGLGSAFVPIVGTFLVMGWWGIAQIIGLSKIHEVPWWRAAIAVSFPGAFFFGLAIYGELIVFLVNGMAV